MKLETVLRWALPALAGGAAATAALVLGPPGAMLGVATAALGAVIVLLWWSVQSLTGEAPMTLDDAMTLAAPSVEEERKTALLRALRDLEYERSVGKISEGDYHELSARYRAEAKDVLRLLDASRSESAAAAEREIEARLQAVNTPARRADDEDQNGDEDEDDPGDSEAAPARAGPSDADAAPLTRACAACSTRNEPDAVFCKRCGARLAAEEKP